MISTGMIVENLMHANNTKVYVDYDGYVTFNRYAKDGVENQFVGFITAMGTSISNVGMFPTVDGKYSYNTVTGLDVDLSLHIDNPYSDEPIVQKEKNNDLPKLEKPVKKVVKKEHNNNKFKFLDIVSED